MRRLFVLVVVVVVVVTVTISSLDVLAQSDARDARALIDASTAAMGTANLRSIQYSGTGTIYMAGQAFASGGPWPRYTLTKYTMSLNYVVPAMRQDLVRIDDETPPRGGGAGGFNPATGQGGIRPVPGDMIQSRTTDASTEAGALALWLTPHGFLKGATANAATATTSRVRGRNVLSFTAFGKYTVTATLNDANLVERVETHMDVNFTGDTLFEGIYSDYRNVGGVQHPIRILMRQGGFPTLDVTVTDVQPNSSAALDVRAIPTRSGEPRARAPIQPERIADGVWFMNPGVEGSILVTFNDYLVLIEGPRGDRETMTTLEHVKTIAPNTPVKYVVNTHHHADHAGGLRAYVAEGIAIITHETHRRYYEEEIFKNPHTLNPDRLALAPRPPIIETVTNSRVLTDGRMTLEIHHLRDNPHSEGLLVAYLPRQRLLIQADAFHPRPGAGPLPAPSPFTTNMVDNLERLKLDVDRVVHVHGGISPLADVLKAAGK